MSVYSNNALKEQRVNDAWYKLFSFIHLKKRILDVGCSSGHLGEELIKQKKAYVVGLDINKEDIESAKKVLNEAYVCDLEKDSVDHLGKFDVIIMADVIEHLVDPVTVLKKLKTLLNKDGIFVFSIPNMANVTTRIELLKGSFEYKDFGVLDRTHLHFYDYEEVSRVFYDAGYQVQDMDCSIRTIPKEILSKDLKDVGLIFTEEFENKVHDNYGYVFQFIGYAKPSSKITKPKVKTTSPLDSISKEIDSIREELINQINERQSVIKKLENERDSLIADTARLNNQISAIYNSKSWKLIQKAASVKNKIRKPI